MRWEIPNVSVKGLPQMNRKPLVLYDSHWKRQAEEKRLYLEIQTPNLKAQGTVLLNLFCSAWVTQQMLQHRENVDVG